MSEAAAPHGEAEVFEFYGWDPKRFGGQRLEDAEGALWEKEMIVSVPLPAPLPYVIKGIRSHSVRVHRRLAERVETLFHRLHATPAWAALSPYAGSYAFRTVRGGVALSVHGLGGAFDFNPAGNPLGSFAAPGVCGALLRSSAPRGKHGCHFAATPEGRAAIAIFERAGFMWGGRFEHRLDCMHFQYATGY